MARLLQQRPSAVNDGFNYTPGIQKIFISLAFFRVKRPDLFRAAFNGSLQIEQVKEFYGIREEMIENRDRLRRSPSFNPDAYTISGLWSCLITGNSNADGNDHFSSAFDTFGDFNPKDIYEVLKHEFFGSFKLPD
ncbi:hypothetical protein JF540_26545 [Salipiger thiooxidans]|uniref:hypothetical protein n=1 Tax=Salipiger thiooxidans TaxID=282683 RepID=UPI001A8C1DEF|nr:hypothetical protein [Salipiger thiooxidans]MBN8190236.1 hypothetical protein [Salipiger thiooxidans]